MRSTAAFRWSTPKPPTPLPSNAYPPALRRIRLPLPGRRIFGGRHFQVSKRMIAMTNNLKGIAAAGLLLAALNAPCRAEDAAAPPPAAAAQTTQGDAKSAPADVQRPSITAKSTDTTAPDAASEPAPRH